MKKFLLRLGIFLCIIIVCDIIVGVLGCYLVNNAKGGDTKRENNIGSNVDSELLIFGSSRAFHHYDPDILEDVTGMTTYNCGFTGNGIICAYGYMKMVEMRYHPKMIVYEITPSFDLLTDVDNHTFLGRLRYYYDRGGVDSIFWNVDKTERYKMLSWMYRFNSVLPQLLMDNLYPLHSDYKGYRPLDKKRLLFEPKTSENPRVYECDSLKLYYLEKLITDCEGKTILVFAVSPMYKNINNESLGAIHNLCEKYSVPLLDHSTDSTFNNKMDYFDDRPHLCRIGATEYSKVIASEIKQLLEQQTSKNKSSGT